MKFQDAAEHKAFWTALLIDDDGSFFIQLVDSANNKWGRFELTGKYIDVVHVATHLKMPVTSSGGIDDGEETGQR